MGAPAHVTGFPPVAAGEDDPKGMSRRQGRQSRTPHFFPLSIFGDLIDKDVNTAISLAKDRIEWKKNRPRNAASPTWGINAEHITHYITTYWYGSSRKL